MFMAYMAILDLLLVIWVAWDVFDGCVRPDVGF